jgi:hypothetical protein
VHILIPAFPREVDNCVNFDDDIKKKIVLPGAHESQHHKGRAHGRVILTPSLGCMPLRHAENFDEQNGEENKQNKP